MNRFFVNKDDITNGIVLIKDNELMHLNKVLRLKVGDKIICLSGNNFEYISEIISISRTQAEARILDIKENLRNPKICIDVFLGFPKGEKLNLITQKLTELGVNKLTLFESDFTIAKANLGKLNRLGLISQEACKQCGRSKPLQIEPSIKFKNIEKYIKDYEMVIFAYEKASEENTISNLIPKIKKCNKIALIIGAEGGFSEKENELLKKLNTVQVFLGNRILKVETACIALSGFLSFITDN